MRKLAFPLAAAMALGLGVRFASAAPQEKEKEHKISGVLIDKGCAEKFTDKDNPEEAAAKHPKACALSCHKKGSDFVLLHGKDELKLDKHGQELATEYLTKEDSKTKVTITGEKDGDELKVTEISAAEESKEGK